MKRIESKIYLAGRISKHDWRDKCGRSDFDKGDGFEDLLTGGFPVVEKTFGEYSFPCTGPHFVGDNHGCGHGTNQHGTGIDSPCIGHNSSIPEKDRRYLVVKACLDAISRSDVVFAWLEPECYGTVAELGYAKALKKQIFVAGPGESDESDMWFAFRLARFASTKMVENPISALDPLLKKIWNDQCLLGIGDSPIETQLFQALCDVGGQHSFREENGRRVIGFDGFNIYPQYSIGVYKLDFAVISDDNSIRVAVEADGHDFHERTKEQAEHDRKRDRYLQTQKWMVLRFTGREIHRDAKKCANEIIEQVLKATP